MKCDRCGEEREDVRSGYGFTEELKNEDLLLLLWF